MSATDAVVNQTLKARCAAPASPQPKSRSESECCSAPSRASRSRRFSSSSARRGPRKNACAGPPGSPQSAYGAPPRGSARPARGAPPAESLPLLRTAARPSLGMTKAYCRRSACRQPGPLQQQPVTGDLDPDGRYRGHRQLARDDAEDRLGLCGPVTTRSGSSSGSPIAARTVPSPMATVGEHGLDCHDHV